MIHRLANRIASIFVLYGESSEQNADIYAYAIEAMIAFFVNLMICLFIALIFGRVFEGIVFILGFAVLRRYTGGYHAKSHRNCILTFSCIVFCAMMFLFASAFVDFRGLIALTISTLATMGIFAVAIIERKLKYPNGVAHCKLKKNGAWIVLGIWLISVMDIYIFNGSVGLTLSLSIIAVFASMVYAICVFVIGPKWKGVKK